MTINSRFCTKYLQEDLMTNKYLSNAMKNCYILNQFELPLEAEMQHGDIDSIMNSYRKQF